MKILPIVLCAALSACSSPSTPSDPALPPAPAPPVVEVRPAILRSVAENLVVTTAPGGYQVQGDVENVGDQCAAQIGGRTVLMLGADTFMLTWALDPAFVLRPAERATYTACCIPSTATGEGGFTTTYTFRSQSCS